MGISGADRQSYVPPSRLFSLRSPTRSCGKRSEQAGRAATSAVSDESVARSWLRQRRNSRASAVQGGSSWSASDPKRTREEGGAGQRQRTRHEEKACRIESAAAEAAAGRRALSKISPTGFAGRRVSTASSGCLRGWDWVPESIHQSPDQSNARVGSFAVRRSPGEGCAAPECPGLSPEGVCYSVQAPVPVHHRPGVERLQVKLVVIEQLLRSWVAAEEDLEAVVEQVALSYIR